MLQTQTTRNVLNASTAEFKVPSVTNGSTAVTVTTVDATSVAAHVEAINILIPKLRQITGELKEEIGRHILAIKTAEPNDWEAIVKARCGLSRSRTGPRRPNRPDTRLMLVRSGFVRIKLLSVT